MRRINIYSDMNSIANKVYLDAVYNMHPLYKQFYDRLLRFNLPNISIDIRNVIVKSNHKLYMRLFGHTIGPR